MGCTNCLQACKLWIWASSHLNFSGKQVPEYVVACLFSEIYRAVPTTMLALGRRLTVNPSESDKAWRAKPCIGLSQLLRAQAANGPGGIAWRCLSSLYDALPTVSFSKRFPVYHSPPTFAAGPSDGAAASGVMSNGVHVRHLSDVEVTRALAGKSFHCTMCGKCCSMEEDSEVTRLETQQES